MKDVLDEIVAWKHIEVAKQKELLTAKILYSHVEAIIQSGRSNISMSKALANSQTGIIAEFKRKSPSKGWIKEDGDPARITLSYEGNGATALSILTDEKYFGGSLDFIEKVRPNINIPILRKDFIIDEYQIFQAKSVGANAILLIAADLELDKCKALTDAAHNLDLEVLLELHSINELDYIEVEPDMVGINNRNLGTFHTDVQNSYKFADLLPKDYVLVSESGIGAADTIRQLREIGYRGFLMGEHFMKCENPGLALKQLINSI